MAFSDQQLSGWGRYPVVEAQTVSPRSDHDLQNVIAQQESFLPRGQGRSYGDAALADRVIVSTYLDCIRSFDRELGIVKVEAGITFRDLLAVIVPAGWFVGVTPGTSSASIGGAIAADVHGKNHHNAGSFRSCVLTLTLLTPAGERLTVSPEKDSEVFEATLGGMGLTGFITEATLQLTRISTGLIREGTQSYHRADELLAAMEAAQETYSVAWIDLLSGGERYGRGLLSLGEHEPAEAAVRHPTLSKGSAVPAFHKHPTLGSISPLQDLLMRAFNGLYFANGRKSQSRLVPLAGFFYPLDALGAWNKLYGSQGFVQYQLVIPQDERREGLKAVYDLVKRFSQRPYLCVLKSFGDAPGGTLAFPMHGPTLAMDFPRRRELAADLALLDGLLLELGGRVYLAKDAVSSPQLLQAGYPNLEAFCDVRKQVDPAGRIRSAMSMRLELG